MTGASASLDVLGVVASAVAYVAALELLLRAGRIQIQSLAPAWREQESLRDRYATYLEGGYWGHLFRSLRRNVKFVTGSAVFFLLLGLAGVMEIITVGSAVLTSGERRRAAADTEKATREYSLPEAHPAAKTRALLWGARFLQWLSMILLDASPEGRSPGF